MIDKEYYEKNEKILICENGIHLVWQVDEDNRLRFLHFSAKEFNPDELFPITDEGFNMVEMNLAGRNRPHERHGNKFMATSPGYSMKYADFKDTRNDIGRKLIFTVHDEKTDIFVDTHMQFYDGLSIVRIFNVVRNEGDKPQVIEYISTFNYEGFEREGKEPQDKKFKVWIPHNSWQKELNWKAFTLPELGLDKVQEGKDMRSSNMVRVSNVGNWSSKEYLPMGYIENTDINTGLFWQIEHNGSWHWEIGDQNGHMYLGISGPNEVYSHWAKNLEPGESFETVKVAVGVTAEGFDDAMGNLTEYRRRIRRPNNDNEELPVIFNDYMNCLWGKPTEEEEYPLIDAAAEAGCEYYCIDAGWYADGDWWDLVGEWKESSKRFPNGLKKVTDYIRSKGMIPGVWLEPEVMGICCKLAKEVPDDWFFVRHGRRIYDRSRHQLDYRNPEVRAYMDSVVDRIVTEYGVGYFKFDYNIEPGIGTELDADSYGDGMLCHERCYLKWLEGLWERYPDLIIENCSSGGLRMDYAMLSRCSIQSTSDQDKYLYYATIATNAPTGVTPEQAAVWSYPLNHDDDCVTVDELKEETVFNLVSAMLLRIHQSGHLAKLDTERKNLVKEGISVYKEIRKDIPKAVPFWPIGLSSFSDEWSAMGLRNENKYYLAVWRREGNNTECKLPIKELAGSDVKVKKIYPSFGDESYQWSKEEGCLKVTFEKEKMARLFCLTQE